MKKAINCKRCKASFVPETDLQKITMTCKECFEEITRCKASKEIKE